MLFSNSTNTELGYDDNKECIADMSSQMERYFGIWFPFLEMITELEKFALHLIFNFAKL